MNYSVNGEFITTTVLSAMDAVLVNYKCSLSSAQSSHFEIEMRNLKIDSDFVPVQ